MMPPGHVAVTWGVSTLLQKRPSRLDYRLLALAAMLPDLIDKPLAMLVFTQAHTSQLVAHSLLFHVAVLVLALLFWRKQIPCVLAFNGHLLADRMWRHTESFWWPLFGRQTFWEFKVMNSPQAMASVYWDIITRYPEVWVVELLALVFLARFAARYQLYRWPPLKKLLFTGKLRPCSAGLAGAAKVSVRRARVDL
jgi:hypothetical protein